MHIWVDADACPAVVKDILYRASQRWQLPLTLVANQALRTPPSPLIRAVQVPRGFDVADALIVERAAPGDLVITADIPLAAEVLAKGACALNPRGELYSVDTIRERLAMRDMMEELRAGGVMTGGPATLSQADRRAFGNQLDALLSRRARAGQGASVAGQSADAAPAGAAPAPAGAGPDAGPDVGADGDDGPGVGSDVGSDVRPDVGSDVGPDVRPDVGSDVGPGVGPDDASHCADADPGPR